VKASALFALGVGSISLLGVLTPAIRRAAPYSNDPGMVVRTLDGDPPVRGAFGATATVEETAGLHLSFPYGLNADIQTWDAGNGGYVASDGGKALLHVAGSASSAYLESREATHYVPGQGIAARFTFVSSGCVSGQRQEVGIGDSQDGFFFGCQPDGGFGAMRRSRGVDYWVPQTQWNGERFLPDSGATNLNIGLGNVGQIQYQWLGYGQVTYSLESPVTGRITQAHAIKYANTSTETTVFNPTFPMRIAIANEATDAGGFIHSPSMGVIRQGPEILAHGERKAVLATRALSTTTDLPVIVLRNDSAFGGQRNRVTIKVDWLSLSLATGSQTATFQLRRDGLATGGTFANINAATSVASTSVNSTQHDGGIFILPLPLEGGAAQSISVHEQDITVRPGETLTVVGRASSGTPSVTVGLSWLEEF
jgi:hypothetical protein